MVRNEGSYEKQYINIDESFFGNVVDKWVTVVESINN